MNDEQTKQGPKQDPKPGRPIRQILKSTLGAAVGVQSREVYEQDFSRRSPARFIVAGIVFTLLFIGSVLLVVNIVLRNAG